MHPELSPLLRELLYAHENRLLEDDVGLAVRQAVALGVADSFVVRLLHGRVHDHMVTQAFEGPFLVPHLEEGEIVAGVDSHGHRLSFPLQFLNAHTLTVGGSGSGKTTSCRFRILQITPRVRGSWLFDFRKREYALLRPYLSRVGVSLIVVPARKLRLNPLQVPTGVHPADWAPRVADMLVQVFDLPPRATKLLHLAILEVYRRSGVRDDRSPCPTLFDLREAIASDREANVQAKAAVVDSMDPVLMSLGPDVLAYRRGWRTEDLAERHLVFELDGVAEADKDLVLNSVLLPEFMSRVARGISNPRMNLFICCDEALRMVAASSTRSSMADLLGLIRGTGIGLDLSVQTAEVLPSILSNTATKFIGRCGSAADYDRISAAMGLNADQRRWLNLHLQPGLFVGQLGEGGWRHPFVVRVPPMQLSSHHNGGTGDSQGLGELLALPTIVAPEFQGWSPGRKPAGVCASSTNASSAPSKAMLSEDALRFLATIINQPGQPSGAYAKLARVSKRGAVTLRQQLVAMGLVREHAVLTNRRGRPSIVLEPTPAGADAHKNHAAGATT